MIGCVAWVVCGFYMVLNVGCLNKLGVFLEFDWFAIYGVFYVLLVMNWFIYGYYDFVLLYVFCYYFVILIAGLGWACLVLWLCAVFV